MLVYHGLRALAESRSPGIRALLDVANIGHRGLDAEDIAFRIAPLINAAGRMGSASDAVDLLLAPGYVEAQEAAKVLERHNEARRKVEKKLVADALAAAERSDDPILVLAGEGEAWHPGVLGIVASRVTESLGKPAILIAFDGERGRGSGRSGGTLDLRAALAACTDCLVAHGGHTAAVGLEIERSRLDEFRRAINAAAGNDVRDEPATAPEGHLDLAELDPKAVRKLDLLGPFGAGNRRPAFSCPGVRRVGRPHVDARGHDLRLRVAQNGTIVPARLRGGARRLDEVLGIDGPLDIVCSPRLAPWAEDGPVELVVHDLRPARSTD